MFLVWVPAELAVLALVVLRASLELAPLKTAEGTVGPSLSLSTVETLVAVPMIVALGVLFESFAEGLS